MKNFRPSSYSFAILTLAAIKSTDLAAAEAATRKTLEEVLVVAQKREERMQDVPISMNVMSDTQLAEQNITTVTDLARIEPSLNFQQGFAAHSNNYAMRGITSYSLEGGIQPSVSLVVDGIPLFRAGEFASELADIARVEVLKGPQGTFFGKNSTGGAINLVRNRPTSELEGQINVSLTTDDEELTSAMLSGPLLPGVNGRIAAYYKTREGHIKNVQPGTGNEGGEESWGIVSKLDFTFSESVNLLLTGEYRLAKSGLGPQVTVINTVPEKDAIMGPEIFNDVFKTKTNTETGNDVENWGITAELSWEISDTVSLASITGYRDYYAQTLTDIDASPASGTNPQAVPVVHIPSSNLNRYPDKLPTAGNNVEYLTQELRVEYATDSLRWVTGAFYQGVKDHFYGEVALLAKDSFLVASLAGIELPVSSGEYAAITTHPDSYSTLDSAAIFTDITWNINESLEVFGGYRITKEEGEIDHNRIDVVVPAIAPCFSTTDYRANFTPDAVGCVAITNEITAFTVPDELTGWSGRLGGKWYLTEDTNMYFSVSRSFVGIGFDSGRNSTAEKATLEPTTSKAAEIGIKSILLDNTLRLNLAAFIQNSENLQVSRLIPGTITAENINAGNINSQGVELSLAWRATDNLSFNGSASWVDAEIDDLIQSCYYEQTFEQGCNLDENNDGTPESQDVSGKPATLTPEYSYSFTSKYEYPLQAIQASIYGLVTYSWQDKIVFPLSHDPILAQDAYGLVDVSLGLQDTDGEYEIALFGTNITDKEWHASKDEAAGVIGRLYVRTPRGAQAYWGLKGTFRF